MILQDTKELKELAAHWRMTPDQITKLIILMGTKHEIFEDIPECYGVSIKDHIDGIGEDLKLTFNRMFPMAPDNSLELFSELVTIGEGECPFCGGDGEYHDGEERCTGGDGYLTPYEYEPIWEERKCTNCGHIYNI